MTRYAWLWRQKEIGVRCASASDRRAMAWLRRRGHGALLSHIPTTHSAYRAHWRELERAGTITATRAQQLVEAESIES